MCLALFMSQRFPHYFKLSRNADQQGGFEFKLMHQKHQLVCTYVLCVALRHANRCLHYKVKLLSGARCGSTGCIMGTPSSHNATRHLLLKSQNCA